MAKRKENSYRNIFWGMINKFVSILVPFATRTTIIYTLGIKYVGLESLFASVLQVMSFAELGISGAIVFSMYKPISEHDDVKVSALLGFYKKAYIIIGSVIFLIGIALIPFLDYLISGELPSDVNLKILYIVYLINNLIGYFLFSYKESLFQASQRTDIISKVKAVLQAILGCLQIITLLTVKSYFIFVLLIPLSTIINNLIIFFYSNRFFSRYTTKEKLDKKDKNVLRKKIEGMMFQKIGDIVLHSVDTIVISSFLGLISLGVFQNYNYIITAVSGFLIVINQSIIPSVGNSIVTEEIKKNYSNFKNFNFIYTWLVIWFSSFLLCLYQPFMEIWVGVDNMLGYDMVVLFVLYFFVNKWTEMLFVYQQAIGLWNESKYIPLISAIVNLTLNIILVQKIGLPGILISTIIAKVVIYDIGFSFVLFRTYFKSIDSGLKMFWEKQMLYFTAAVFVLTITWLSCSTLSINNPLILLFFNGIICILIPNIVNFLFFRNLPEFVYLKTIIKSFFQILM